MIPIGGTGLQKRVYLLMATGIFFPLALMATVGFHWLQALDERILAGRLASAETVAAHYDEILTGDLEMLQRLAAAVSKGIADGPSGEAAAALKVTQQHFRHRESVFLLAADGSLLLEEPRGPVSAAPRADDALVQEVLRSGLPRLSGLVLGSRGPVIHELVPIRRWDGRIVGVAGGTFAPARRELDQMLRHLRRGQTGFAELVDAKGVVVASTLPGRTGGAYACPVSAGELISSRRGTSERCDDCHVAREVESRPAELLSFAPLASAPWGVMVRQSVAEALPTEGAIPWYVVVGGLVLQLGVAGAFAWGAARSVTHPVAVLTAEAERIAGGDLASPIPDLGTDEVGRLGKSLEAMRGNLRHLLDSIAEVNAQLEQRVAERTWELGEANARLREREQMRAQLLQKVISAQEDERKRIARELHDETSQSLAVLAMGLEGAQDAIRAGRTPRLDEVKAVAVRTLEDVHRLILDLRPSVLDDLGLLSAIRWYGERHLETRGMSVRCEFGELDRRLPSEMETALFRICQEAMSNVARHSQATAVLVQVGVEAGEIRIEIEDDGKGFDPAGAARRETRRPWGLMGIRERAEILGGSARIDSAPGQGTRVLVRIPLPAGRAPEPALTPLPTVAAGPGQAAAAGAPPADPAVSGPTPRPGRTA